MTVTVIRPLLQADVAYLLRRVLGPIRVWEDVLSDMRQGKTTYHGLTLLPIGRAAPGKKGRPLYAPGDVRQFVRNARSIAPPAPNAATALTPLYNAEVDLTCDRSAWRRRILLPVKSVARVSAGLT